MALRVLRPVRSTINSRWAGLVQHRVALGGLTGQTMHLPVSSDDRSQPRHPSMLQTRTIAFSAPEVATSVARLGELKELGLGSAWTPVGFLQNLIEACSAVPGVPWWVGIVGATLLLRAAMLPVVVGSTRNGRNLMNIREELDLHRQQSARCAARGDYAGQKEANQRMMALMKETGAHPLKSFLPILVQAPVFISMFIGIRKMCYLPVESMANGGTLWFPDLTATDPSYMLPIMASGTMLLAFELGMDRTMPINPKLKWFFRGMSGLTFVVAYNLPAGVLVYWTASSIFTMAQSLFIRSKLAARLFDIPEVSPRALEYIKEQSNKGFMASLQEGMKQGATSKTGEQLAKAKQLERDALSRVVIPPSQEGQASAGASSSSSSSDKAASSSHGKSKRSRKRR